MGVTFKGAVRRVRAVPRGRLTTGAVIAALIVSIPFGGLKDSQAKARSSVAAAQLNQVLHADPFDVTFTGAATYTTLTKTGGDGEKSDVVEPAPGNHVMMLKATVVNRSNAPVAWTLLLPTDPDGSKDLPSRILFPLKGAVPVDNGAHDVLSLDDATEVWVFNPGVTYHLAIAYEYAGPVASTVTVGIAKLSYEANPISTSVFEWQDPTPAWKMALDVTDKTAVAP